MKLDVSCKVFCHLMCNLCLLATARGLCTMQNELSRIETPGYKSYLVHTNKVKCYILSAVAANSKRTSKSFFPKTIWETFAT